MLGNRSDCAFKLGNRSDCAFKDIIAKKKAVFKELCRFPSEEDSIQTFKKSNEKNCS